MTADSPEKRDRQIAESVEALSMLKDQICGMYAALVKQMGEQAGQAGRLKSSEDRLIELIGGLPNDPVTLGSIKTAAERVESTAAGFAEVVKTAIDALGAPVATSFTAAVAKPTADIKVAAAAATAAAGVYSRAVRLATWKAAGVALLVSLGVTTALAVLVAWWIPPLEEIQARRAELERLNIGVANLAKRGGKAKLAQCGKRLCVQTDESGAETFTRPGETYRLIKGY